MQDNDPRSMFVKFYLALNDKLYWEENHDASRALRGVQNAVADILTSSGMHQTPDGEWYGEDEDAERV